MLLFHNTNLQFSLSSNGSQPELVSWFLEEINILTEHKLYKIVVFDRVDKLSISVPSQV